MYRDYKHNSIYWQLDSSSNTAKKWYASIGNQLAQKNIEWANKDIEEGFANFYFYLAYFQEKIPKPWINERCLKTCSMLDVLAIAIINDDEVLLLGDDYKKIPRNEFKNIYFSGESSTVGEEIYRKTFYDKRMDDLVTEIMQNGGDLSIEALKLNIKYRIDADKKWRGREIKDFPISSDYYLDDYHGNERYGFEGFQNIDSEYLFKQLFFTLTDTYIQGFEYQVHLSTKKQWVYSKYVNEKYQWILLFNIITPILCNVVAKLMLCKRTIKNNVKPKDVVFQHDFFARHGGGLNVVAFERALYSQYFYYVNRSLERFIDWMQPKILEVVDSF